MEFTLYYRGELKSNGSPKHKHKIRSALSPQLEHLWSLEPLSGYKQIYLNPIPKNQTSSNTKISLLENLGGYIFAPFISDKIYLNAELEITLLRPQAPGEIIMQSGDIDNRLKTLFDALSVPAQINQIPENEIKNSSENPIYCLLQDDRLISSVLVKTDRLLDTTNNKHEVVLLIQVKTKITRHIFGNTTFI